MNLAIYKFKKDSKVNPEQMHLVFAQRGHFRSFIESQQVTYPYHIGRCLSFPDDPPKLCNVYIQSCSGGMFDFDRWRSSVIVKESAQVHLSTSASNIIHRCDEDYAEQIQTFEVEENAYLEFIPMSNILFPKSKLHSKIDITLHNNATVCFFDSFQASTLNDDQRPFDQFNSEISFYQQDKSDLRERFLINSDMLRNEKWGFNGDYKCFGSFYMLGQLKNPVDFINCIHGLKMDQDTYLGINYLQDSNAIVIRLISRNSVEFHKIKFNVLNQWRQNQFNKKLLRVRK